MRPVDGQKVHYRVYWITPYERSIDRWQDQLWFERQFAREMVIIDDVLREEPDARGR